MLGIKTIEEFTLEECEAFLKREDISKDERQGAEKRKNWLLSHMPPPPPPQPEPRKKTIMEEFPEYDFRPTSLLVGKAIKDKGYAKMPIIIGGFLILLSVVFWGLMSHYSILEKQVESDDYHMRHKYSDEIAIFGGLGSMMLVFGICALSIGCVYRKKYMPIKAAADYVSYNKKGWQYLPPLLVAKVPGNGTGCVIFVKNRKFGVLKYGVSIYHVKIVIPSEYDSLTWLTSQFLLAERNGKKMIVDLVHNSCTDGYDKLSPVNKNNSGLLYEVEEGGRTFLIDVYGNKLT